MQIEKSDEEQGLMKVKPTENKIRVLLPAADYNIYTLLKVRDEFATILSGTIVLPALMEAISLVEEENSTWEGARWYQILKTRLDSLPPTAETSILMKAQQLYEQPVYRVCSNLASVAKGGE